MTRSTAHALDRAAARAFPVLVRLLAIAAAVSFVSASGRLVALLASFHAVG